MFTTRRGQRARTDIIRIGRYRAASGVRRALVAGLVMHATLGYALAPAWRAQPLHYVARDTPLPDVLKAVVSAGGLQLKIAPGIKEPVNGAFDQPPERVFAGLIDAYGLAWYYDGHVIHVSRASDIQSRTVAFAPMKRADVVRLLSNLGLDDAHLPVRYSDTTAVVTGPAEYVDAVADAVAQAQEQVEPTAGEMAIRVFALHYAQAQDITYNSGNQKQIVPGVASLLRKLMADMPSAAPSNERTLKAKSARREARGGPPPLPSLRGLGLADRLPAIDAPPLPEADGMPVAAAPMRRNIVADARTNSIVIYDVPSMMPVYERTIATLDKPQDLVEITAAVIDVSCDAAAELGIRFDGAASGRWGTASATTGTLSTAQALGRGLPLPSVNLATMVGDSATYLFARVRALETSGKARILSRPQVLTLNNTEAVLSSRNSVYVRVAGNQDVDLYNVDTGLTLKVTPTVEPLVGDTKNILLSVQIEDGAFDSSASVDGIPKVSHNSIVTQAVIGDGQSLLVGGYQYERSAKTASRVPVLSSIPFVGGLFRGKREETQRLERLILITPRIKSMTTPTTRAASWQPPLEPNRQPPFAASAAARASGRKPIYVPTQDAIGTFNAYAASSNKKGRRK